MGYEVIVWQSHAAGIAGINPSLLLNPFLAKLCRSEFFHPHLTRNLLVWNPHLFCSHILNSHLFYSAILIFFLFSPQRHANSVKINTSHLNCSLTVFLLLRFPVFSF
ncbi:hypothetical protein BJ741DRAFT_628575, partial [Chytriomyces cf. hyalinus JEL632]